MVVFEEGETGVPGEKPSYDIKSWELIEPDPHWWEASALKTTTALYPWIINQGINHWQNWNSINLIIGSFSNDNSDENVTNLHI